MTNSIMTTLMWTLAVIHVLTDRILWPFIQSAFAELTTEPTAVAAPPVLTVAVTEAPAPVTAVVKTPHPARRRKQKTSATVTRLGDASLKLASNTAVIAATL